MKPQPVPARSSPQSAAIASAGAGFLALVALVSWWSGLWRLLAFEPDYAPMTPSTAVLMLLVSIVAFLRAKSPPNRAARVVESVSLLFVLLSASMLGLEGSAKFTAPFESWLFQATESLGDIPLGRMSPLTAACFVLLALALLCGRLADTFWRPLRSIGACLSLTVLLLGAANGLAYLAGHPFTYGNSPIPMAWLTALGFALLGVATLLPLGWEAWPLRIFVRTPPISSTNPPNQIEWPSLLLFAGASLVIITAALVYLHQEQTKAAATAYAELSAIADLKVQQLVSWRNERLSDGRYFSKSHAVAHDLTRLIETPGDPGIEAEILSWLTLLKSDERYARVTIFNSQLESVLSIPPLSISDVAHSDTHVRAAFATNTVFMTDLHRHPEDGLLHLNLAVPIIPKGASTEPLTRPIAVIDLELNPRTFIFPLIHSWPMPSRTAEALLIRRTDHEILYPNQLRQNQNQELPSATPVNHPLPSHIPPDLDEAGTHDGIDFRGSRVVAVARAIPGTDWVLVAKIDESELYAPLRRQTQTAAVVAFTLLLATTLGFTLVSRRRSERLLWAQLKTESDRRALAERYEHLMKYANDVILLVDTQSHILEANDRAVQTYGWTLPELQRMTLQDLRTRAPRTAPRDPAEASQTGGSALFETVHRRKDGSTIPVEVSANFIEVGGAPCELAMVRDITQRKLAEEQLRGLSDRLQLATRAANIGIWEFDPTTNRLIWDDAMFRLYGVARDQFTGTYDAWKACIHPEDLIRVEDQVQRALRGEQDYDIEFRTVWPDGSVHHIKASGSVQRDQNRHPVRMLGTNWDITDRKRTEAHTAALSALGLRLNTVRDPARAAEAIADVALDLFSWDAFFLVLYDPPTDSFKHLINLKWIDGHRTQVQPMPPAVQQDPFLRGVLRGSGELVLHDAPRTSGATPNPGDTSKPAMSLVYVPVRHHGECLGVLSMQTNRHNAYTPQDLLTLQGLADHCAGALSRIQAEATLRHQVELQNQIAQIAITVPGTIYSFKLRPDGSMCFPYASQTLETLFGLTPESVREDATPAFNLIHPDDVPLFLSSIAESARTLSPWRAEFRVRGASQSDMWMEGHSMPQSEPDGSVLWHGFLQNITERKLAEERLRKLSRAVEQSPAVVIITDLNGKIEYVNPKFVEITGYSFEDVCGKNPSLLKGGDAPPEDYRDLWQTITRGEVWHGEFRNRRKDGELFWEYASISPILDDKGNVTHFLGIKEDITRRKQLESDLALSRRQLDSFFTGATAGMVLFDRELRYARVNHTLAQMDGLPVEAHIGKTLREVVPRLAPTIEPVLRQVMITGKPVLDLEVSGEGGPHGGGQRFWLDSFFPIAGESGIPVGVGAVVLDITERKRLEQERAAMESQLRQRQRLDSIGTLASGVAHEINNPINGIMNYAQLIQDRLDPQHPLAEFTGEIIHETHRIATIVNNLLTFSRTDRHSHSPARIADILDATLSLIRTVIRHDQITLNINVPPDLPKLLCRSQQIQQVLMNLMTNSRDALNERYPGYNPDKIMNIEAQLIEREGRSFIRLTVEDHGIGIPPLIRERMFDPFFTTKTRDKGTGLGLSISHGIVKEHHGTLSAESEPGRFTRMHLELPVDAGSEN